MGGCQSIIRYEDDDDRLIRLRNQAYAREMREFQNQLRKQQCFSEMDLMGRGISKKNKKPIEVSKEITKEQMLRATNIVYDA